MARKRALSSYFHWLRSLLNHIDAVWRKLTSMLRCLHRRICSKVEYVPSSLASRFDFIHFCGQKVTEVLIPDCDLTNLVRERNNWGVIGWQKPAGRFSHVSYPTRRSRSIGVVSNIKLSTGWWYSSYPIDVILIGTLRHTERFSRLEYSLFTKENLLVKGALPR